MSQLSLFQAGVFHMPDTGSKSCLFMFLSCSVLPGRWECPWHQCDVCQRASTVFCDFCPASFCRDHERGSLVPSALEGRACCPKHNPQRPREVEGQAKVKIEEIQERENEKEEEEEEGVG